MGYDRIVSSTLLRESRITILSVTRQTQSIVADHRSSRLTTKIIKLTMLTVANPLTEGTAISRIPPSIIQRLTYMKYTAPVPLSQSL